MTDRRRIGAFILMKKRSIPSESAPTPDEVYDGKQQIWISLKEGVPLVLSKTTREADDGMTPFGETLITETREGADQSEGSTLLNFYSPFGETLLTKTQEGTDQREAFEMSRFGETLITTTHEGVDQPEVSENSQLICDHYNSDPTSAKVPPQQKNLS